MKSRRWYTSNKVEFSDAKQPRRINELNKLNLVAGEAPGVASLWFQLPFIKTK